MEHKKHEQLQLIYFGAMNQPQVNYFLDIPEVQSVPPDPYHVNSSGINNYTTNLYDTNNSDVGLLITSTIITSISALQNIESNTFIFSLPNGTMTFGFTLIQDKNDFNYIGGQIINLNFMYGSGEYQNVNVKYATLLPVNDPNKTRLITVVFDD
jgi:hypothetical protein